MLLGGCLYTAAENKGTAATDREQATYCRFVPERMGDFAWENDRIAFRAYVTLFRKQSNPLTMAWDFFCVGFP